VSYSAAPVKQANSESGAGTPQGESLVTTLEMTTAIGEIQAALETLQSRIGVIAAWSDERRDDGTTAREVGQVLLAARQAAAERMAEIESEREEILTSARQMAQTIVAAAEERAHAIEAEAIGARGTVSQTLTTTVPRIDPTLIMPKVTNGAGHVATDRAPAIECESLPASIPDSLETTPLDTTQQAAKTDADEGPAGATPQTQPQNGARSSRAADLLAALTSFTAANASLAEDVAAMAHH
jgi:hypothetical protein